MADDKEEIIMELHRSQQNLKDLDTYNPPSEYINMPNGPVKRLCILLFFLLKRSSVSTFSVLKAISVLKRLPIDKEKTYSKAFHNWKGPITEMHPLQIISHHPNVLLDIMLVNSPEIYWSISTIKKLIRVVTRIYKLGDVPYIFRELNRLPGITTNRAILVLEYAWGRTTGIVLDTHVMIVMNRLNWVTKEQVISASLIKGYIDNPQRQEVYKMFQYKIWKYVYTALKIHADKVCFTKKPPNCKECILNTKCPSAFNHDKFYTYLDNLHSRGHFPETNTNSSNKKQPPKEPAPLDSFSEDDSD
ncbi:hypothetical protein NEOKW01_1013 [Nematocida sp. AWRm80]|nr:hypothetical protein NEOKW01_1013 [Nematocida sp. AWRm80]